MPILASTITASMRFTLLDQSKVAFDDTELFTYLNEGMVATCSVKMEAYGVQELYPTVAGMAQALTDFEANGLLAVLYNNAGGEPVTLVDKALLEIADPTWQGAPLSRVVRHYMYDPRTPKLFMVWPPAEADVLLMVKTAKRPPNITALTDYFPMTDTYMPMVLDYALSRAYMKNSKKQDTAKASFYYSQWAQAVGLRSGGQYGVFPPKAADGAEA